MQFVANVDKLPLKRRGRVLLNSYGTLTRFFIERLLGMNGFDPKILRNKTPLLPLSALSNQMLS